MNKKIASFIPNFWQPHLETDVELIKRHICDGDQVRAYICNGDLPSCYGNLLHSDEVCKSCISRRRNAFSLLGLESCELRNFINLTPADEKVLREYRGLKISTIEELRAVRLENCMMGQAAFNELASHIRETNPNLLEHQEYIARVLESAATVYLSFKNNLREYEPDLFYTFNGRFVVANAALAAVKALNIPFAVHDRSFVMDRYTTVFNDSLHSVTYWSKQAESHWDNSSKPLETKTTIGSNWFEERIQGLKQGWYSFTNDQNVDLPSSFDPNKTNLVFFNTSEFETVGMDDYRLPLYESQNEGIEQIAKDLQNDPHIMLYLRVHPNLKDRINTQTRGIAERLTGTYPNLEVIAADSPISTYNLMKHADAVITFGSTTGAEAAYFERPVILLGKAFYQGLDFCYMPESHNELIETIRTKRFAIAPDEAQRRKQNAIKYAYFMASGGNKFQYFEQTDVFEIIEKKSQLVVGYTPPAFSQGLQKEIEARIELKDGQAPNPLAGLVRELSDTATILHKENEELKAQLQTQAKSAPQPTSRYPGSLHRLSASVKRLRRLLCF